MSIGIWQILLVVALVVLLFGRNKISDLMGDVAKGIKSFKKGMAENDNEPPATIDHNPSEPMSAARAEDKTKAG
ncbi:MAG TPA: twin-arginine translocase TatA/TatE family subunit [Propylenella sp.]|jgi:sec-independent protein translocase protein TatA